MASPATAKVSSPSASGSTQRPVPAGSVQEFSIRVPKNSKKKFQVMRFNANLGINLTDWKTNGTQIKMERENNLKEFKGVEEEIPKFGAGSEFGKEAREEARRKKFGITAKKYKADNQPWILKMGGKTGKKFKGIREGGVGDNTAYYVFTQAGKGVIEAYPLQEWYKFQPIQRYKALSAEEAEEEFGRRNKIINYFSVMMKKRLKGEDDTELEELEDGVKGKGKGKAGAKKKDKNELKISEMDDWVDSDDDGSGSDSDGKKKEGSDEETPKGKNAAKGKKKIAAKKKKKKKDSDDEAFEESDDGDEEGREMDYISDSSDSASDHEMKANKEQKGVADEDALRKLINSESEDEDEQEKKEEKESNSEDEEKKKEDDKNDKSREDGGKKKKRKDLKGKKGKIEKKSTNGKNGEGDSSSELSPNSTDTDSDAPPGDKPKPAKVKEIKETVNSAGSSRSTTPTPIAGEKRKLTNAETAVAAAKKSKLDTGGSSSTYLPPSSETGVTEDAVRRYLMRKPMTTKELVHKFKSKKTNLTSDQLVNLMTQILKNINPVKQMIKNQLYLSLKPT